MNVTTTLPQSTQIIVTLDDNAMVSDIKKAIKLIRGVVSVKVIKPKVVKWQIIINPLIPFIIRNRQWDRNFVQMHAEDLILLIINKGGAVISHCNKNY